MKSRSVALMQSGLSPRELSLTLCLGTAVGVMPLVWGTTVLCVALAAKLKLNQAAMLALNYLCYPLQLALFLPFCRLGEFLLPLGPMVGREVLMDALHGGLGASLRLVAWATARALGVWFLTTVPLALLAYPVVKRLLYRKERRSAAPEY
ncbi:MAG TPA: DUF2062 domain-containing protein [Geobacter sp.]|nr:DUF2062 domain-containing protein [Geobacter sp.]